MFPPEIRHGGTCKVGHQRELLDTDDHAALHYHRGSCRQQRVSFKGAYTLAVKGRGRVGWAVVR